MSASRVIRAGQARSFMDGPEHCREYLHENATWIGTSTLQSGQTGPEDPGHPNSVEFYFCAEGQALVAVGETHHELGPGDVLVIPPTEPHTISNVGSGRLTIVWAGAPT